MTPSSPEGPEREARTPEDQTVSWDSWMKAWEAIDSTRTQAANYRQRAEQAEAEVDRLTAEVERLRAIADAAEYVQGPEACLDQECEDFCDDDGNPLDPMPERCSHMTVRYATADDAEAALWHPEMIRLLEKERDTLQERLALSEARRRQAAALDELSSQGGDYLAHKVEVRETGGGYRADCRTCGDWYLSGAFFSSESEASAQAWADRHKVEQGAAVAARSEATPGCPNESDKETPDLQGLEQVGDHLELGRPPGSRAAEPQPVEAAVDNDLRAVLLDHYGFIPLAVRYEAAEKARRVVDLWRNRECPSPLSDSGKHFQDYYDARRFPCDWCGMRAPEVSTSSLPTQKEAPDDRS